MKSIVINEATEPKTISANSLVTSLSAGGSQSWVPEDETHLQTKTATRNGRVKPDSGFYGLSEVNVMVKGTYPSPGDTTPIKPAENEQMENGTVFVVAIAGGGELNFVPVITIGNAEREGVISVVDFSNAKIECMKIDGMLSLSDSTEGLNTNVIYFSGAAHTVASRTVIDRSNNTVSYTYSGQCPISGSTITIGRNNSWRVSGIQYNTGEAFCFAVTVHVNNAAT